MEISTMVIDLKKKIEAVEKETRSLTSLRDDLTKRLETLNRSIATNTDDLEAMKMALESLELVGCRKPDKPAENPADRVPNATPVAEKVVKVQRGGGRKPKKVMKCDAMGNQVRLYWSISECAKDHNLGAQSIINMIEKGDRASMLANRGYYLVYA